jgi:hypothetical protein
MEYKTLINSKSLLIAVSLLFANYIHAQRCVINKMDSIPFHFNHTGLIGQMYNGIRNNDSSRYQAMLIRSFAQMNRKEAYYISIGLNGKIKKVVIANDSVLLSKSINYTDKYDIGFISKSNMTDSFLISNCQNVISSHKRLVLVFFDHSLNKWIEYTSLDGYMKEALEENKEYFFLKNLYEFIGLVFKDVRLYGAE